MKGIGKKLNHFNLVFITEGLLLFSFYFSLTTPLFVPALSSCVCALFNHNRPPINPGRSWVGNRVADGGGYAIFIPNRWRINKESFLAESYGEKLNKQHKKCIKSLSKVFPSADEHRERRQEKFFLCNHFNEFNFFVSWIGVSTLARVYIGMPRY